MSISTSESIVTQVAVKAAAELVATVSGGYENIDQALIDFNEAFKVVLDVLVDRHNGDAMIVAFGAGTTIEPAVAPAAAPAATSGGYVPPAATGPLTIVGEQYGPLPEWIAGQAAKAGVDRLFDNRKDAEGTKKPWFRQALSKEAKAAGQDAVAFWPPKGK